MKIGWIAMILFMAGTVHAQSALVGKRLISRGDDAARVRSAGGKPDRLEHIEGDTQSPAMEVWTYERRGGTVSVWLVDGKVVQVQEHQAGE